MPELTNASAEPEKRLFISLLTRDISLADAFLDLLDNSVNSALIPFAERLSTAKAYSDLFLDEDVKPVTKIEVRVAPDSISISDSAAGISFETARDSVFKLGRPKVEGGHPDDRLSVYGIGLKRAIFKMGDHIVMRSDHKTGGFELDLHVEDWATDPKVGWNIPIAHRAADPPGTGTTIEISDLTADTKRRIGDGAFEGELREKIAKTYAYFIGRVVDITLNDNIVLADSLVMGDNYTSEYYDSESVTYSITAGLARPTAKRFSGEGAGWYVFCNGRTVIFADKTSLTGWGDLLPQYQPKHRPFLGIVFFVSPDPEALPWTTTKASINVESLVWQRARKEMEQVGRKVLGFLDQRYTDEGTEIDPEDLAESAGTQVTLLTAATAGARQFTRPSRPKPEITSIQFKVTIREIEAVKSRIGRPYMSNSDVGKFTFDYYVRNEIE